MIVALLKISDIRANGGTQSRVQTNRAVVEEYLAAMQAGCRFPPIVVFRDQQKRYWLADGFHRLDALKLNRAKTVEADLREGELRDAVLFAVGTNQKHGLQRTNADKRRCVEMILDDVEWRDWSNHRIAAQCGVSEGLVRIVREDRRCRETAYNTRASNAMPRTPSRPLPATKRAEQINAEEEAANRRHDLQIIAGHLEAAEQVAARHAYLADVIADIKSLRARLPQD